MAGKLKTFFLILALIIAAVSILGIVYSAGTQMSPWQQTLKLLGLAKTSPKIEPRAFEYVPERLKRDPGPFTPANPPPPPPAN